VARDRRRAKQRRERSAAAAARSGKASGAARQPEPGRADVPAALDHASADVDEFDAAIVAGAGGVAEAEPADDIEDDPARLTEAEAEAEEAAEESAEDALQEGGGSGGHRHGRGHGGGGHGGDADRPSGAPIREGNRVIGFLRASWAELQRVQWPDRRQVTQATAVVLGFVAIAGAYLGLADYVAKEIVDFIL